MYFIKADSSIVFNHYWENSSIYYEVWKYPLFFLDDDGILHVYVDPWDTQEHFWFVGQSILLLERYVRKYSY